MKFSLEIADEYSNLISKASRVIHSSFYPIFSTSSLSFLNLTVPKLFQIIDDQIT